MAVCPGCGDPLPARAAARRGSGRRARYHSATCRQRARRARLATTGPGADLLAAAERAERASAQLRRTLLTGQNPDPHDSAELLEAATTLASAGSARGDERDLEEQRPERHSVTKKVTNQGTADPGGTGQVADRDTSVTKRHRGRSRRDRAQALDLGTVRCEKGHDFASTGAWQVRGGSDDDATRLGYLERTRYPRVGWQAKTPNHLSVPGGPWRTRQDALVHLIEDHLQK